MKPPDLDAELKKIDDIASLPEDDDIAFVRKRIDSIDDELIELLLKRIELSNLIMKTKPLAQIIDPRREQAILTRYSEKLAETSTLPKTKRLVLGILGTSRLYPES